MALAETAQLVAELTLRDHLSGSVGKVNSSLSKLQGGAGQAGKGLGQLAGGLTRVGVVAAGAAATGIGASLKLAGNFEAQLNTINTVAQVTPTQLQKIGDSVRGLARDTGTPLDDLTGAYYDLVSAGVSAADAQNVLTQANTLAIGGLGSTAETVDLLTTAINSYGGDASKAKEYTDQFAVAIANGKVTAAELAANFADVGPLAATMGIGIDQISASIGQMTAKGTKAPEAFTQIRAAMVALQRQTPELKTVMKDLGIKNIQTELDSKGLAGTWDELRKKADALGIPLIKLTGRVEGQQYVLQNTGDELKGYNKNLDDVKHASDGAGTAAQQMAERQKGLNFQLDRLKALAKDAGITIGSKLLPKFVPFVEKLNDFIANNQDKIGKFGDDLATGLGKFLDNLKDADFSGLIDGLKMMSTIGKGVVDLFMSLPPQVQAIAVAGLSLNKISGGLLGKGAGNLIGGLIKIGFERGSSPANPLFVADVSGGLGGGGGIPGAGGSIGSKVLGFGAKWVLGPAAAVVIGAEIAKAINDPLIAPAKKFESGAFDNTLKSDSNVKSLQDKIDAINQTLDTSKTLGDPGYDALHNAAVNLSGIPIIGDALGNLKPELEKQRDALQKKLDEVKREQTHTSSVTAHSASEHNAVIRKSMIDNSNRITGQLISRAASDHADAQGIKAAADRAAAATQRQDGPLSSIVAGAAATAAHTDDIRHKNFSPTVDVGVNVTTNVTVNSVTRKIVQMQRAAGRGFTATGLPA